MSILLIESLGGWNLAVSGVSGTEALRAANSRKLHLIILDLDLEQLDGIHVLRAMRHKRMSSRILVFTGSANKSDILTALSLKPAGFVHKSEPLDVFRAAIDATRRGSTFLSPYATDLQERSWQFSEAGSPDLKFQELTVLKMVAEGRTNRLIGVALGLSPRSVEYHRHKMMRKLGLKTVLEVRDYALRRGFFRIPGTVASINDERGGTSFLSDATGLEM